MVAFHDYGFDLPQVTQTINTLIEKNKDDIDKVAINPEKYIIFIKRREK